MDYQHSIHFTPDEANHLLEEVVPKLQQIREAKESLDRQGYDIRGHHLFAGMGTNGTSQYPENVDRLIALFRDLTARGILIKDMERGLVDFPAIRENGDEVYLCYELSESTIGYWHPIDSGFHGRRPLSEF